MASRVSPWLKLVSAPAALVLALGFGAAASAWFGQDWTDDDYNSCSYFLYSQIDTDAEYGDYGYSHGYDNGGCSDGLNHSAHWWNSSTSSWFQQNSGWVYATSSHYHYLYAFQTWEMYGYFSIHNPLNSFSPQISTHVAYP